MEADFNESSSGVKDVLQKKIRALMIPWPSWSERCDLQNLTILKRITL